MAATFDSLRSVFEKTMKTNEEDFGSVMKHAMTMSRRPNPADTLCELGRSEVVCLMAITSLGMLDVKMSITMSKAVLDFKLFPDITAYFAGKLRVEYNIPKSFLVRAYTFALFGNKLGFLSVPSTLVSFMRVLINEAKEEDDAPATNLPSSDNDAGPSSPKRRKLHKQQAASKKTSGGPSSSRPGKPPNLPIGRPGSPPARPPTTSSAQLTPAPPSAKPGPSQRTPSAKPGPSQQTPSAMPGPSQRTPLTRSAKPTPSAIPALTPVPQKPPQDPEDRRRATEELWKAVKEGEDDRAVKAAVEAGADVRVRDMCGETPLHWAARRGREAAVLSLISHGAELEAKNWYGWTPLHRAANNGHLSCTKLLVERGADPNARTSSGETPLHVAAMRGREAAVLYLISRRAELEAKSVFGGWTPLHWAAYKGHLPCTKLLVERGADPNARASNGRTPLALAVWLKHHTVQQYLESVGGTR